MCLFDECWGGLEEDNEATDWSDFSGAALSHTGLSFSGTVGFRLGRAAEKSLLPFSSPRNLCNLFTATDRKCTLLVTLHWMYLAWNHYRRWRRLEGDAKLNNTSHTNLLYKAWFWPVTQSSRFKKQLLRWTSSILHNQFHFSTSAFLVGWKKDRNFLSFLYQLITALGWIFLLVA